MKKPFVAGILSFLLPGAGLAYLGKWKWAFVNFGVVVAAGIILAVVLPVEIFERYVRVFSIGFSAGSAGWAYATTQQLNMAKTVSGGGHP